MKVCLIATVAVMPIYTGCVASETTQYTSSYPKRAFVRPGDLAVDHLDAEAIDAQLEELAAFARADQAVGGRIYQDTASEKYFNGRPIMKSPVYR